MDHKLSGAHQPGGGGGSECKDKNKDVLCWPEKTNVMHPQRYHYKHTEQ